jgi:hypothetical protein
MKTKTNQRQLEITAEFPIAEKNSCNISSHVWNFARYFNIFIYFTVSRGSRNDVLRHPRVPQKPGWEMLSYKVPAEGFVGVKDADIEKFSTLMLLM